MLLMSARTLYVIDITGDLDSLVAAHTVLTKASSDDVIVLVVNPKPYNQVFCYAATQIAQYLETKFPVAKTVYANLSQNKRPILFDAKDLIRLAKLFEVAQSVYEELTSQNKTVKEIKIISTIQKELLSERLWARFLQALSYLRILLSSAIPTRVIVDYPVANMSVRDLVLYVKRNNLPYRLTWSCLDPVRVGSESEPVYRPCGICIACQIRQTYRNLISDINQYTLQISSDVLRKCAPCSNIASIENEQEGACTTIHTMLIPLYAYPTTYGSEYNKLLTLDTKDKQIIVIVNPANGPGTTVDPNYTLAIRRLKERGYTVIGYVYTQYGNRPVDEVTGDMSKWTEFYPEIDGFFIDETANTLDKLEYYRALFDAAKSQSKLVVLNAGTIVPAEYYNIADIVVVFENHYHRLDDQYFLLTDIRKACYLIYGVPETEVDNILQKLTQQGVRCAYITNRDATDPELWARVSPYIDKIAQMDLCQSDRNIESAIT